MTTGWDQPPDWLVDRIGQEIRRGLVLVHAQPDVAGFALEAIRFSIDLRGRRQVTSFDGEGRRVLPGGDPDFRLP